MGSHTRFNTPAQVRIQRVAQNQRPNGSMFPEASVPCQQLFLALTRGSILRMLNSRLLLKAALILLSHKEKLGPGGFRCLSQGQCLQCGKTQLESRSDLPSLTCLLFLSMSIRAPVCTTCGGHRARQSLGEVRQLRRICTACGRLPGNPLRQAPSWIPEVCTTTACRVMEPREEHHLLPSHVLPGCSIRAYALGALHQQKREHPSQVF